MYALAPGLRARGVFAARAGVSFCLTAAAFGAFYFFTYEVLNLSEPARYGFWVFVGGVFLAICGASTAVWLARRNAHVSVFVSALLGLVAGVFWAFAATIPLGLYPGRFEIPIIVVWPLGAMFAFAYAEAAQGRITRDDRGPLGVGVLFALLAIGWTFTVKNGFHRLGSAVDFARMPIRRYIDTSGLGILAQPRGSCWDPAPPPQPLPVDSNAVLTALGSFSTPDRRAARLTQHVAYTVDLWAAGPTVLGVMTSRFAGKPNRVLRSRLEAVDFDRRTGALTFYAFYADGYYDRFEGEIEGDELHGSLTTADAACIRRVLTTDRLLLKRRETRDSSFPFGQAVPTRVAHIAKAYPTAYVRPPIPAPVNDTGDLVPASQWAGPLTVGARFEAQFSTPSAAARMLNDSSVIARFDGKPWSPAALLVKSETLDTGRTTWMIAGPLDVVRAYLVWIERPEYAGLPPRDLRYDFVRVACCANAVLTR